MSNQTYAMDPDWLHWHQSPSQPIYKPPPGAVDAHCHVFGPGSQFPFAPERKYTPCDASKNQLYSLRDFLGFTRNVVVQATCHGADNSALVDCLLHSHGTARGVATVKPDVTDEELRNLHEAGVRGVRFNYVKRLVDPKPDDYYRGIIEKIKKFRWHVVLYFEAADLDEKFDFFTSLPCTIVADHMGRPDVTKDADGPAFAKFMDFMARENVWCKVTCPDRLSKTGPPNYDDFVPFAKKVVERYPDRVLWGTDWPHPNLKSHVPDDGKLVDVIPRIAITHELQEKLLVDNPMRLYWPEKRGV